MSSVGNSLRVLLGPHCALVLLTILGCSTRSQLCKLHLTNFRWPRPCSSAFLLHRITAEWHCRTSVYLMSYDSFKSLFCAIWLRFLFCRYWKMNFADKSLTTPLVFWAVSVIAINFTIHICSFPVSFTVAKFIGCENFFSRVRFMTSVRFTFNCYFKLMKNSGLSVYHCYIVLMRTVWQYCFISFVVCPRVVVIMGVNFAVNIWSYATVCATDISFYPFCHYL